MAGFGNVLRGDDGFGVEVIRRLERESLPEGVTLMEVGTGGIRLAQELLSPYDHLIVVDAVARGGEPGSLYALQVDEVASVHEVDLHAAVPARALSIAKALGGLPPLVHLIGCEPLEVDDLLGAMSPPVERALDLAVQQVKTLIDEGRRAA